MLKLKTFWAKGAEDIKNLMKEVNCFKRNKDTPIITFSLAKSPTPEVILNLYYEETQGS
tara:strand:+ start:9265 stop:9441 length:177 start_codon:yes stop_codon:yes gene_type:complete